eukprot:TRINITY_DN4130_c0_g2_i1.p2 TRINITY_DN4130_c0_g2~~TRINITY_DN4130_c0_g2_i1.p2  ORF type:complete len:117 (-),score=32.89 TRINITY_DN4130_c0_g2_i1:83-433(-)
MDKLKKGFEDNPEQFVDLFFECLWDRDASIKPYFTSVGMRRLKTMFVNAFPLIIDGAYDLEHLKGVHQKIQLTRDQLNHVVEAIVDAVEYNEPLSPPQKAEIQTLSPKLSAFLPVS